MDFIKIDDDVKLWERCIAGDRGSWEILVDRYGRLVCKTILDTLKKFSNPSVIDWKDIYQDVFLKLKQKLHQWKRKATLATYIRAVAYHATIDRIRKQRVDPQEDNVTTDESDPLNRILVKELMSNLTPGEYLLISLHFLEEWSLQEIAELFGKDIGAIYTMKTRALAKLRKIHLTHGQMQEKQTHAVYYNGEKDGN
ncbi:MAG: sigma-70 family RNA polymerase sigma factor [Deltaproteobacteria bacterium]|nr:sigma-70 family RNA polymerase sigma factor [Deltaproteobacteria bacterium]